MEFNLKYAIWMIVLVVVELLLVWAAAQIKVKDVER
ncbi:hypothetical protein AAKU67_001594 [Oxalobacteraceae bacterium GrIS 2.11]